MSTQPSNKTGFNKNKKMGNIKAYTKDKLATRRVCRPTIKPITQKLQESRDGAIDATVPYPRFFLFFELYGDYIQNYLSSFGPYPNGKNITVEDVANVLAENAENELADQACIESYNKYDSVNKGCNIGNPFVINLEDGYVPIEHCMMEYILDPFNRDQYMKQTLLCQDGRYYDILECKPLNNSNYIMENYYFYITKGYTAQKNDIEPDSLTDWNQQQQPQDLSGNEQGA